MNPFEDNIVPGPRRIGQSVGGLNEKALQSIVKEFAVLSQQALPRIGCRLPKALLLVSPDAGFGKTHLIGRLFKELAGKGTLIYIRPFIDPEGCWQSILNQTVQEMDYPDDTAVEYCEGSKPRQLDALVHGVMAHLTADLLLSGVICAAESEATAKHLQENPASAFEQVITNDAWANWIRQSFRGELLPALVKGLNERGVRLRASAEAWLTIFYQLAFFRDQPSVRTACLDWLTGQSISDEDAAILGLPSSGRPMMDASCPAREQTAHDRLLDLSQLAAYYRPFVFCFDQTENYGRSPELVRSLGMAIQVIADCGENALVIVTANQFPWREMLRPHLEQTHRDRIKSPHLELEGITKSQAEELLSHRFQEFPQDDRTASMRDGTWTAFIFRNNVHIGIRQFLNAASIEWDRLNAVPSQPRKTIPEIHAEFTEKIKAKPGRLVYDADFFQWLVREVGTLLPKNIVHIGIGQVANYFPSRWNLDGKTFLFSFESGNNWNRWGAIMRTSARENEQNKDTVSVMFRTPDLQNTPRSHWKIYDAIRQARKTHMRLINLPSERVAAMYACRDMYAAAMDIEQQPEEILSYTAQKLSEWWSDLAPFPAAGNTLGSESPKESDFLVDPSIAPAPDPEAAGEIANAIRDCFASFNLTVEVLGGLEAPQLIRYKILPSAGVKVASLIRCVQDLQVALKLPQGPLIVAAEGYVALDIPRPQPQTVKWEDIMRRPEVKENDSPVSFPIGVGIVNDVLMGDFQDPNMAHALVAGASGSGKSEFLKSLAASLTARFGPETVQLTVVDPKLLTFSAWRGSPYLSEPVITELPAAIAALTEAAAEMDKRYQQLADEGFTNLAQRHRAGRKGMPWRVLIFDEFADLILISRTQKVEFETLVARLAGKGRACGIHLVLATQRPDKNIVTGLIKANLPLKICLKVTSGTNSKIVINETGGESLVGRGDLLCDRSNGMERAQSPFLTDDSLSRITERRAS